MKKRTFLRWAACLVFLSIAVAPCTGAVDAFLKIDGIEGESTDEKHKGEIDVLSFSFGMSLDVSTSAGGAGASKPVFSDITIVKQLDKSSPKLYASCASGKHIPTVVLTLRAGPRGHDFYKVTLEDVLVTSINTSGSSAGDTMPTESVSFNFSAIIWEYVPQSATGGLGAPVKEGWNVKENRKI